MSSAMLALGLVIGIAAGLGTSSMYSQENRKIIQHGCAEYNSTTGNFQWKDK